MHVRLCMCVYTLREGIALWRGGAAHLWCLVGLLSSALPTGGGQLVCNLLSSLQEREREGLCKVSYPLTERNSILVRL